MKYIILLFLFPASLIAQSTEEAAIRESIDAFSRAIVARDINFITNAYTADASIFPNNYDIVKGSKGIAAYWMPRQGDTTTFHKIYPEQISIEGTTAYDHGYYTIRGTNEGTPYDVRGKYVIVWKKEEGQWKMYLDIWNRAK